MRQRDRHLQFLRLRRLRFRTAILQKRFPIYNARWKPALIPIIITVSLPAGMQIIHNYRRRGNFHQGYASNGRVSDYHAVAQYLEGTRDCVAVRNNRYPLIANHRGRRQTSSRRPSHPMR